jgi:hypothetical protein
MRKELTAFLITVLMATTGFILLFKAHLLVSAIGIDIDLGGDKSTVFFALFFGVSIGSIMGVIISEKCVYKVATINIMGIIVSFCLSVFSSYGILCLMDRMGSWFIVFAPILSSILCLCGRVLGNWGRRERGGRR